MNQQIFYNETFNCLIRDKERVLFKGEALALSTKSAHGDLDILPGHSHFVSIIENKIDIVRPDGKTLSLPVIKAILKVFDGEVRVYLGVFSSLSTNKI